MDMVAERRGVQRGLGSDERPLTEVLWRRDSRVPTSAMLEAGEARPDNRRVDFGRYHDPAFAKLEYEKLWNKSWLLAAREEDAPQVGDRVPFDLGYMSFIIIRAGPDVFRAFYNSCPHRGTRLCSRAEGGDSIRCPYHGWEWKADGSLKFIPSHWDFPTVTRVDGALREVRLERWGGFIFINADPAAVSLADALAVVPRHFAEFGLEQRYTAARFRKLMPANWKVVQEAFMESYHVLATHPEAVPYNGDSQAQYDIWDTETGHIGRQITPSAVPSMHAPAEATTLAAAMVYATIMKAWHYPDADMPELDPAGDLRAQIAQWHRDIQARVYGVRPDQTDAVMIDSTPYFMFPSQTFWLSESLPFIYSFTPHATDCEQSYFDVRMLLPVPEGSPRPPSSPAIEIGPGETVTDKAPAFNFLAAVFDQDIANMPLVQAGLKSADPAHPHSQLGAYQEMIIQHWNDLLDRYLAR